MYNIVLLKENNYIGYLPVCIHLQPMVHCVSSSEPDSGDTQMASEDWRIQGITTKDITLNQPSLHGKTYVESTVTTGIQVGTHVEQVNRHLTVIDLHQAADTTHPENTYADSQDHMDTSSPNHSINSDTMDHATVEDQPINISKEMTDVSYSEIEINSLPIINHGHYQPILYHSQHYVPNANVYRQQALVPDHAHYTMLPHVNNKFNDKSCIDTNRVDIQNVPHVVKQDEANQNSEEKLLERHNTGASCCPQNVGSQKFVSVGIAPSGLYPHLYNYRSDPNGIAVVNYSSNKPAYINPYVYNQFIYAQEGDDGEESESSEEE